MLLLPILMVLVWLFYLGPWGRSLKRGWATSMLKIRDRPEYEERLRAERAATLARRVALKATAESASRSTD